VIEREQTDERGCEPERNERVENSKQAFEKINRILESITDAFFNLDRDWQFTYLNQEAQRLLRKSDAELLGSNVWLVFSNAEAFRQQYERAVAENRPAHFEEYYARLATWFEVHAYPSADGISVYFRDVTQRKQTEQALRDSEADLKHAQAVAQTGSWRLDVHRNELFWSDETYRMFGIAKGTPMTYEAFLAAVHPEDRKLVVQNWQAALDGAPYDLEHRIVVGGQIKWVREKAELEFDGEGKLLSGFGAVQDITERKLTEQALMRAEKLASAGRLAATLAHEINNPLGAALNCLYLASGDMRLAPSTRDFIKTAEQELRRAAEIVKRTLGFYREPNGRTAVAVVDVIEQLKALYEPRLKARGVQLQIRKSEERIAAMANAGELRQLLSNLLLNGVDALGERGTVYVRVGRCSHSPHSPAVRITIADTGKGIEPETLRRIFEPFFTTKQDTGTGLGLWISEQIVKKHGGSIRVRSRVGRGTVFSILLPAANVPTCAALVAVGSTS
jgi:PAS domain S-box-containing protein